MLIIIDPKWKFVYLERPPCFHSGDVLRCLDPIRSTSPTSFEFWNLNSQNSEFRIQNSEFWILNSENSEFRIQNSAVVFVFYYWILVFGFPYWIFLLAVVFVFHYWILVFVFPYWILVFVFHYWIFLLAVVFVFPYWISHTPKFKTGGSV